MDLKPRPLRRCLRVVLQECQGQALSHLGGTFGSSTTTSCHLPLGQTVCADDTTDEATSFDSRAHFQFFRDILEFCGQTEKERCVCFIADNASVNKKIARLLNKHHVGCLSHKLHLDVWDMISNSEELSHVVESVQNTMKGARALKNAAVLRNITDLKPVLPNVTRWSGMLHMLKRFYRIRDELLDASKHKDSNFSIDASDLFASKLRRLFAMLSEIDVVSHFRHEVGRLVNEEMILLHLCKLSTLIRLDLVLRFIAVSCSSNMLQIVLFSSLELPKFSRERKPTFHQLNTLPSQDPERMEQRQVELEVSHSQPEEVWPNDWVNGAKLRRMLLTTLIATSSLVPERKLNAFLASQSTFYLKLDRP